MKKGRKLFIVGKIRKGMEEYKKKFIEFLLKTGALRVEGDFTLKSKRSSPWFVNIGDFNEGESTTELGRAYAHTLVHESNENHRTFDIVYGIPEKGNALAVATSMCLAQAGLNFPWFFTRKVPKEYGEATDLTPAERIKALVVGRAPKEGQAIAQLDDVFTAGDAKYEAKRVLQSLGEFKYPILAIAVDRQEVGIDGKSAIEEYEKETGTKVASIVNATEIYQLLSEAEVVSKRRVGLERMTSYLRVYGTQDARNALGKLEYKIVSRDRSVIPACDVETIEQFEALVKETADVEGIGAYKIGFELGLNYGLPRVVETARKHTQKPLIYDHQKAGTDIPDTGKNFARTMKKTGIDAVIFFPQSGPETERAWIYHAFDHGLNVIVGGRMTHPAYAVSEGGFITDKGAMEMYHIAARAGVNHFVVPGNKPDVIEEVRSAVIAEGVDPVFFAPGFIAQGGKIEDAARVAGEYFHGIVGRGIYGSTNMREAALEHTSQLN